MAVTVQLHMPRVVPKALFAECRGPVRLVHEADTLSQCHLFLAHSAGNEGQTRQALLGVMFVTAALAALFAAP